MITEPSGAMMVGGLKQPSFIGTELPLIRNGESSALGILSRQHVELFHEKIAKFVASGEYVDTDMASYSFEGMRKVEA